MVRFCRACNHIVGLEKRQISTLCKSARGPSADWRAKCLIRLTTTGSKLGAYSQTGLRTDPPTVVGIDDWAFRRNLRYETIVCDIERRRIVTLLPDREVSSSLARRSSWDQDRVTRSRWRLWRGGCQGATRCGSDRRSLAPDEERQRGLPRRSASPCVQSAARSVRIAEAAARKLHESGTYVRLLTPGSDLLTALSRRLRSAVWSLICWTFFRSPLGGPAWSSIARLWQLLV